MVLMRVAAVTSDLKAMRQFNIISRVFTGCRGLSPTPSWQKDQSIQRRYFCSTWRSSNPLDSTQLLPGFHHRIPYHAQAIQWFKIRS